MVTTEENNIIGYRDQCSVKVDHASLPQEDDEEDSSLQRNMLQTMTGLTDVTHQRPEENRISGFQDQFSVNRNDTSLPQEDDERDSSLQRNMLQTTTGLTDVTHQRPEENRINCFLDQFSVNDNDASLPQGDDEDDDGEEEEEEEENDDDDTSLQRKSLSVITAAMQNSPMPTSIFMENSNDVQIGPRLHYNAPVTINQYVHVRGSELLSQEDLHQQAVMSPEVGFEPTMNGVHQAKLILKSKPSGAVGAPCSQPDPVWKPYLRCLDRRYWLALLLAATAVTTTALLIYYFSSKPSVDHSEAVTGVPVFEAPTDPPNPNNTLPDGGRILSKSDWGGYPAKEMRELPHPTPYVVISHTAGGSCFDAITCASIVRNIQDDHIGTLGMVDIGYNFLVSGDGNVFEGRGWDATNFHPTFVKRCNIGVCFMGHFVHEEPTAKQVESVKELLDLGVRLGKLDANYKLVAHSQTAATLSPGNNILNIIQKWPHFWVPTRNDTA